MFKKMEFVLYGLDKYRELTLKIFNELDTQELRFDIDLLLLEGLSNAFIHGNKKDKTKPIYLRVEVGKNRAKFEIEDCGTGFENISIPTKIQEDNLLEEHGRGLFLINCCADKVEIRKNVLIIEKKL